jgi:glycosyltransferase involved in cell wall biosynthesis
VEAKERAVQSLTGVVEAKERAVQSLTGVVEAKDVEVKSLSTQVENVSNQLTQTEAALKEKGQVIQDLTGQLEEIHRSKSWKIALFIRRIYPLLAPPGSRRARFLTSLLNFLMFPFKKILRNRSLRRDAVLVLASTLFDQGWYLANNLDVAASKMDPLLHYLRHGGFEGRDPGPDFSSAWYLNNYADVKKVGLNPLIHYLKFGHAEGRFANPKVMNQAEDLALIRSSGLFDEKWYLSHYPDIAQAQVDPLIHFLFTGGFEGRDPGPNFSTYQYLSLHEEIKKTGLNPLVYYLKYDYKPRPQSEFHTRAGEEYVPLSSEEVDPAAVKARLIAFYLPQFHPIPENDQWWGKGFTEWTNVSRARPNFKGHYQPHLPGELGFYDLRLPEVQKRQMELARKYGLHGFCYYYYWFNGKRLLEKPLDIVLNSPDMDFPFCICWANENWTRRWDGAENEILIGQEHSEDQHLAFIRDVIPILKDRRYIRVDGKPLLAVYRINLLPNPQKAAQIWRAECRKQGLGEICLVAVQSFGITDPRPYGFDAAIEFPPHHISVADVDLKWMHLTNPAYTGRIFDYQAAAQSMLCKGVPDYTLFKTVIPAWDNTPRRQNEAHTFINSTPAAYKDWLAKTVRYTCQNLPPNQCFIFINAWNEWAEGTYLEPDQRFGYAYLQATAEAVTSSHETLSKAVPAWNILFVSHDANKGGAQTSLLNTITWFKLHTALNIHILCLEGGELLPVFQELAPTVLLSDLTPAGANASADVFVSRLLEACDGAPDLIYGNTVVAGKAYPWLSRLNVPILTHVHELESSIQYYAGAWMDDVLKYSTRFLACSKAVLDNLVRFHGVPADRISVAAPTISRSHLPLPQGEAEKDLLRQKLGLITGKRLIFGCGLGMPFRKGADLFISLAEALQRSGRTDFHLYWIGGFDPAEQDDKLGRWSDYLKRLEKNGLDKLVTFLGYKKSPREYLRAGDIHVLTSREEPFGLVVLEAAECGLPTVCFDNAGAADFVGKDAGFVTPLEDVQAMADRVGTFLDDADLRRSLGERAREKFLNAYTIERLMPHTFSACRQVAGKNPSVSIILPNFNHAQYLPLRLDSIFEQTYQDFEVILIDDASTDNSLEVLQRYADRGDVQIIKGSQNSGSPFKQWLKGLDLAHGDFWWIAESDDVCEPNFLASLLPAFKNPLVKLAYANSHVIDESGKVVGDYLDSEYLTSLSRTKWRQAYRVSAHQEINEALGIKDTILNVSAVVFRKTTLPDSLRETLASMRNSGDWYFVVNMIKDGEVAYEPEKLNYHRRHSESVIGKILQNKKTEAFFQEFFMVQDYVFKNYKLAPDFPAKWEAYLRQLWHDFYPERPFQELNSVYPFDEMRARLTPNSPSAPLVLEDELAAIDRQMEAAEPLAVPALFANIPLDAFGKLLLDVPTKYPNMKAFFPSMPSDQVQDNWTGSHGETLLRQSVAFINSIVTSYSTLTGRSIDTASILDFGCGWGRLIRLLYKIVPVQNIYGVDPWDESINLCRQYGIKGNLAVSDYVPQSLPFERTFDMIFAFSVFTHLSEKTTQTVLKTLRKYIAEDGLLVITIRPKEYWNYFQNGVLAPAMLKNHDETGYAFTPHNRPAVDGDITYGDTSMSIPYIIRNFPQWKIENQICNNADPYQILVFLKPV